MYPHFKNKYLEKALISPSDVIALGHRNRDNLPNKWIIFFQSSIERYIRCRYNLERENGHHLYGTVYVHGDVGLLKIGGMGSPHAVAVIEELIGLSGSEFLVVGTAGGLDNFGIFLCNQAIRDEGTSYHYIPPGKYSYPDEGLSNQFGESINKCGLDYEVGTTWTIDAFYRETKKEVSYYKKEGVKIVEMEASALFAVAQFREVKIAAAYVVSDLLTRDFWNPQFDNKKVKMKLNRLIDACLDCFSS